MNIASDLLPNFLFCSAGFVPLPDVHGYLDYTDEDPSSYAEHFQLDSSDPKEATWGDWRIHFSFFGECYAAIPHFSTPLPPFRIDLRIPEQTEWPSELWSVLGAKDSVHMIGPRVKELGIAQHLCRALTYWSRGIQDFERQYRALPFGSEIVARNIRPNIADMKFALRPNHNLAKLLLSVSTLDQMWPASKRLPMPPCIRLHQLQYVKQLGLQVALVSLDTKPGGQLWVFKSRASGPASLYHELKVLLHQPPCVNIVDPPAYLVTVHCPEQGDDRVCGFLLKYYSCGTIAKLLPKRRREGSLALKQQVKWAKEVTYALLQTMTGPANFYSDLRMDNIVVDVEEDGSETAVLLDFEQGRNIYNWAPPEIYYVEWIAELGSQDQMRSDDLPKDTVAKFSAILKRYLALKGQSWPLHGEPDVYDNPPHGWYYPWTLSTRAEQEAGMVFLLAKALWCIFEGREEADVIPGRSTLEDGQQRFPEFRLTPEPLRRLIRDCSAGAREWKDGPIKIVHRGGVVFPLGKTGSEGEEKGTLGETLDAIKDFWQNEMVKAESFIEAKMRYYQNEADDDDLQWLDYLRRPSLTDVFRALELFSNECDL